MTDVIFDIMACKEIRQEVAEEAAKLLEIPNADILLACGEMTAQEMRTVRAVLNWRARAIRELGQR